MDCIVTNRLLNTDDLTMQMQMLRRKVVLTTDIRERIQLNKQIAEIKKQIFINKNQ